MLTVVGTLQVYYTEIDQNGVKYATGIVQVPRESGTIDDVKFRMCIDSEDKGISLLCADHDGLKLKLVGNLRTYQTNGIPRYETVLYVRDISAVPADTPYQNEFEQVVTVLSIPEKVRKTPFGSKILDVTVLSKRKSGDQDRISCLLWNRAAESFMYNVNPGDSVRLHGRWQSRIYEKTLDSGKTVVCVTRELSVDSYTKEV